MSLHPLPYLSVSSMVCIGVERHAIMSLVKYLVEYIKQRQMIHLITGKNG